MPGVVRTRVGYAGGTKKNPTYRNLGNHTEAIQIEYDPNQVSYEELLDVFWNAHIPTSQPYSRQYASFVFYHDEAQRESAVETKEQQEAKRGMIFTEIVPAGTFYPAEDYHQKYYLRNARDLMREFSAIYPDGDDFAASTAAARVNGYLGRHGSCEQLEEEIDGLGLTAAGQNTLRQIACSR
jgi:peptide-methionine (S)-S-oxide reductase